MLKESHIETKGYVPTGGYLVRLSEDSLCAGEVFDSLNLTEGLNFELKVDPSLARFVDHTGEMGVRVHVWSQAEVAKVSELLSAAGFAGWHGGGGAFSDTLVNRVTANELRPWLAVLSAMPEVLHVEPAGSARLLNNFVQGILQSGEPLGPRPFFDAGIYGSNQVVAICDTGLDADSCYFRDPVEAPAIERRTGEGVNTVARKVIAVDFWWEDDDPAATGAWDNDGHGTMVAGCASGWKLDLPYASVSNNGMAPGSKLVIQDCGFEGVDICADLVGLGCPVTNFLPVLRQAYAQGARVHNNSWGDLEEVQPHNRYSEPTRELDLTVWEHRDLLVVCAAGNDTLTNTVDSPSVAKNGMSIGATANGSGFERIASFSSRGWASDGRWKPDVVAPGERIVSSASDGVIGSDNCGTMTLSGTSFSSPATAGMAALVRDYFAQGFYPYVSPGGPQLLNHKEKVSAALVKAVLIQSAVPVAQAAGSIPGRDQGWGRIDLSRALPLNDSHPAFWVRDEQGGFQHGAVGSYVTYVRVRSTNEPLRVTLVWTDPPATVGADFHLVNDLDLHLSLGSLRWNGNILSGGWSVEGGGAKDGINNVERVLLAAPQPGVYILEVEANRIVPQFGVQDFALVVNGDVEVLSGSVDSDADGMADGWELAHWGNLERDGTGDEDQDGALDRDEYGVGTDPQDPQSVLKLSAKVLSDGAVELSFGVPRDRDVTLQYSDVWSSNSDVSFKDFENPWIIPEARLKVQPDAQGMKSVKVVDDFTSASSGGSSSTGARYYRLRSVPSAIP